MAKYCFIINPGSNHKRSANKITAIKEELIRQEIDFIYWETKNLPDAYHLSKKANLHGFEIIVAVGGDGTINQVINGFYDDNGNRLSASKLGVIHTGTSPDFCLSYNIPIDYMKALETIIRGNSKQTSVARICSHNKNQETEVRYFASCASLGLGAAVARTANSGVRKILGDRLGTFYSILKSLVSYKASELKLICDDESKKVHKNFNTFIGKTSYIASGLRVQHQLSEEDNRLYIISLKNINLWNVIPALRAIYSGKELSNTNYLSFNYAKRIQVLADKINPQIEYDGDPQGFLPCEISIAPDRLELIVNEL